MQECVISAVFFSPVKSEVWGIEVVTSTGVDVMVSVDMASREGGEKP